MHSCSICDVSLRNSHYNYITTTTKSRARHGFRLIQIPSPSHWQGANMDLTISWDTKPGNRLNLLMSFTHNEPHIFAQASLEMNYFFLSAPFKCFLVCCKLISLHNVIVKCQKISNFSLPIFPCLSAITELFLCVGDTDHYNGLYMSHYIFQRYITLQTETS